MKSPLQRPAHKATGAKYCVMGIARTMQSVLDVLASSSLETSDAPRIYAQEVERWARGECSGQRLARAAKRAIGGDGPWVSVFASVSDALTDLRAHPTHVHQLNRCVTRLGHLLGALGEAPEAAQHRAKEWYRRHSADAQLEAIAAQPGNGDIQVALRLELERTRG